MLPLYLPKNHKNLLRIAMTAAPAAAPAAAAEQWQQSDGGTVTAAE